MSKPIEDPTKKVIAYDDDPLLDEMGLKDMLKELDKYTTKITELEAKKFFVRQTIQAALETTHADTVIMPDDRRITLVRPQAGSKLDAAKLRMNIMRIGKLDADTVAKIYEKSTVPTEPGKQYIRVTSGDE